MSVNEIILSMRNSYNLSRKEMADKIFISASYYQQLENGIKNPRPKMLVKIANALNFPMDLYFKDEDKIYLVNALIALLTTTSQEDLNRLIRNFDQCDSLQKEKREPYER